MAAHNSDDAEAAFLNAMKALQELENTQNALGDVNNNEMNESADLQGARESTEVGSESGDGGASELSAHEDDEDEDEDNLLKTPASEEVSTAASLLPAAPTTAAAVSSPKTGPSSVDASTNGKDSAHHLDYSPADDVGATQDSSARSHSATPSAAQDADTAADDDGAYVPDENISDRSPPPISINTDIVGGPHNVDSLPVSASVPTPPVSALSAPAPIVSAHNSLQKGAAPFTNKRKRLPQDIVGQLEDRIAEDPRGDIDAWMILIDEHRKKGKLDEARAVFERFFVVFPAAVGPLVLKPARFSFWEALCTVCHVFLDNY